MWTRVSGGKPFPRKTLVAVNAEYAGIDRPVKDGDEVTFFPAGDRRLILTIQLRAIGFDPGEELADYQTRVLDQPGKYGACVSFVGTMRDFNLENIVSAMTLEHYPGMTEKQLQQICVDARRRWDILDVLIVHRIGEVRPNDPLVLVAVWSAHRAAAFDACRYLIEELKTRVPFWKKEQRGAVTHWVEHNTPVS